MKWLSNKTWLAGESLTWLDFAFWENLEFLDHLAGGQLDSHYPDLEAYRKRFVSLPDFAKHWADDSKCMKFPFNGGMAKFGARK